MSAPSIRSQLAADDALRLGTTYLLTVFDNDRGPYVGEGSTNFVQPYDLELRVETSRRYITRVVPHVKHFARRSCAANRFP